MLIRPSKTIIHDAFRKRKWKFISENLIRLPIDCTQSTPSSANIQNVVAMDTKLCIEPNLYVAIMLNVANNMQPTIAVITAVPTI